MIAIPRKVGDDAECSFSLSPCVAARVAPEERKILRSYGSESDRPIFSFPVHAPWAGVLHRWKVFNLDFPSKTTISEGANCRCVQFIPPYPRGVRISTFGA